MQTAILSQGERYVNFFGMVERGKGKDQFFRWFSYVRPRPGWDKRKFNVGPDQNRLMKIHTYKILVVLLALLAYRPLGAQEKVRGRVVDVMGAPVSGAGVSVLGKQVSVAADSAGHFSLALPAGSYVLQVRSVGFRQAQVPLVLPIRSAAGLVVVMEAGENLLEEVKVVSTGYQRLPVGRATGSFVVVDSALLSRRVGGNILERLDGAASGLVFNKNTGSAATANSSAISIRGRSTIYANPNPLVVVDNFPFNGDIASINPDDIEQVTLLKDAASAAIWGAFSGNGVIVITTKKGRFSQPAQLSVSTSVALGDRPDLYYAPRLSSAQAVELEGFLFAKGYFNSRISSTQRAALSPVTEVLLAKRNGQLGEAQAAGLLERFAATDTREGLQRYFYQRSLEQRYSVSLGGGSPAHSYYLGAGADRGRSGTKGAESGRLSLDLTNRHRLLGGRLELDYTIGAAVNENINNGLANAGSPYPYIDFLDPQGNPAAIPNQFRKSYIDTLGGGRLLDWSYRPLAELGLTDNTLKRTEYRFNGSLRYRIGGGLWAAGQYQYNTSTSTQAIAYDQQSFYVRNYINQFTQVSGGSYIRRVPLGGILDRTLNGYAGHNARLQLDYSSRFGRLHSLEGIAGLEQRWIDQVQSTGRLYGYNGESGTANLDFASVVQLLPSGAQGQLASFVSQSGSYGRFRSAFANIGYGLAERYRLSASLRRDQSNVFGVATNQKGVPLWSVGASWEISREGFYHIKGVPLLRLRLSSGYQGNVDPSLSALVTTVINPLTVNYYNMPYSTLSNPPNDRLRWEKVHTVNLGLDFRLAGVLGGTVEYYFRRSRDLIGVSSVDPTSGVSVFKGNVAQMRARGMDLTLSSENLKGGALRWQSTLLVSYASDRVARYGAQPATLGAAVSAALGPVQGYPLYAIYALDWAGLDAAGDPQVYFNGQPSKNYSVVNNSTDLKNLRYMGPKNPPVFGSLRNDVQWRGLSLSVNITYRLGHYFRRQALGYGDSFGGNVYQPGGDYSARWQQPGDEQFTQVPAMAYPANSARDQLYRNASVHVERADHIRLQDLNLGYTLKRSARWPVGSTTIFCYVNNLGILWRANRSGTDPDLVPGGALVFPNPRSYALGLRLTL